MKLKNILIAIAVVAATPFAMADVTVNITGSSAVRGGLHNAIKAALGSCVYAYDVTAAKGLGKANYAIFQGTLANVTGTVTVRTSFSGSVEGVRDLSTSTNVSFLPLSTTMSGGGTSEAPTASNDLVAPDYAMSDVFATTTGYGGVTGSKVSIITFTFMANNGMGGNTISNVTPQQFRALATTGSLPLGVFTGVTADNTKNVYLTGRNDGSGTRVTTLAETGYGYKNLVNQYKPAGTTAITSLRIWPVSDGVNVSNIFNTDTAGNGGYSSGGDVSTALGLTSTAAADIKDADDVVFATDSNFVLLSYLGTSDAQGTPTATKLSYNGYSINYDSSSITNPDDIKNGKYTFWGYEWMYYKTGTNTGDLQKVTDAVKAQIPANVGKTGVSTVGMTVSRSSDGGLVGP